MSDADLYVRAVRFESEEESGDVYSAIQDLLRHSRSDLSVYRFLLDGVAHVAVLGRQPEGLLADEIGSLLEVGESADLPEAAVAMLAARRAVATETATWVEGHYRPGRPIIDLL